MYYRPFDMSMGLWIINEFLNVTLTYNTYTSKFSVSVILAHVNREQKDVSPDSAVVLLLSGRFWYILVCPLHFPTSLRIPHATQADKARKWKLSVLVKL